MAVLELTNVSYDYKNKYQTVHAVQSVSNTFEAGTFYAVIGKSGSGKTTLLTMLAGLDLPTSGTITYNGRDLTGLNRDDYRLRHAAVIYQQYNLLPILIVLENVCFPLELSGTPKKEAVKLAEEKLSAVGLSKEYHKRFPAMLSGGEQQRVAIARALACRADLILADEPTGNLDTENGQTVVEILLKLAHEEKCCVIVVTHDLSIAGQADVVLKMKDGRMEAEEK